MSRLLGLWKWTLINQLDKTHRNVFLVYYNFLSSLFTSNLSKQWPSYFLLPFALNDELAAATLIDLTPQFHSVSVFN